MNLNLGRWCFTPTLLTSLLAVIFFTLFIALGNWQLNRAEYKRSILKDFEHRHAAPVVVLDKLDLNQPPDQILWRQVSMHGHFDEARQILLDNQVKKGTAGYFVYTPFQTVSDNEWILVNRGWVAAGEDRNTVPELTRHKGRIEISGSIKGEPNTGMLLANVAPEKMDASIYRAQNIDLDELSTLLGIKLVPFIVRLNTGSAHGYLREWHPPGAGEQMHVGYAVQWFAFAAVLLIIYLVVNIKKRTISK